MRETASSIQEKLQYIADRVELLDTSLFTKLGNAYVYPYPLKTKEEIEIDGLRYTNDEMVIINTNFPEQLGIYEYVSEKLSLKLRHPSLKENLTAAYDPETKEYTKNVLKPYSTYNGIISTKNGKKVDVRKVTGVKFLDEEIKILHQVMEDTKGRQLSSQTTSIEKMLRIKYMVEPPLNKPPLQTELPTKFGYFDKFKGIVPTDKELETRNKKSKGCWYGTHSDNEGFSSVRSYWYSGGGVLGASLLRPLYGGYGVVLCVWTDENPKK